VEVAASAAVGNLASCSTIVSRCYFINALALSGVAIRVSNISSCITACSVISGVWKPTSETLSIHRNVIGKRQSIININGENTTYVSIPWKSGKVSSCGVVGIFGE
jgi:hypothetical protein